VSGAKIGDAGTLQPVTEASWLVPSDACRFCNLPEVMLGRRIDLIPMWEDDGKREWIKVDESLVRFVWALLPQRRVRASSRRSTRQKFFKGCLCTGSRPPLRPLLPVLVVCTCRAVVVPGSIRVSFSIGSFPLQPFLARFCQLSRFKPVPTAAGGGHKKI
jgi:hypothetical protein